MSQLIIPPDLWEDDNEGVLLHWTYEEGTVIARGAMLAEIMVEKAQLELIAPVAGRLHIGAAPDTIIRKGDVVGRIDPV
jgi:pyruvate/2-oxoglutarate dehydrogenase complex dihydrolipoamide acyltransferase (E2) component